MSSVNKLSVKGIRNFDENNAIEITFSHPLTLIVGQNGVGKTTIIECLRYSTTGEYPPDCGRGKSFIHSVGLNEKKSMNAEIVAEFLDRSGNSLIVSRTIGTSYDKDGIFKLKTLDNSVFKLNKQSGKKCELTHRNADVNEEVMSFMGVSRGILNYVIFCHQDESNWPLAENRTLRECFDEIFEMKRSNKPLKALQKLYKIKQADLSAIIIEKDALFGKIRALRTEKIVFDNLTKKIMDINAKMAVLSENSKLLETRLQKIKTDEKEYFHLRNEELKKETEYEILKQKQESLSSVNLLFKGSTEKLISVIHSLNDYLEKNEAEFSVVKNRICELLKEARELIKHLGLKTVEIEKLSIQDKLNEVRIQERNVLLNQLIRNLYPEALDFDVEKQYHLGLHYAHSKINNLRSLVKEKQGESSNSTEKNETGYDDEEQRMADIVRKLLQVDCQIEQLITTENIAEQIHEKLKELEVNEKRYEELDRKLIMNFEQNAMNEQLHYLNFLLTKKIEKINELKAKQEESMKKLVGNNQFPEGNLRQGMADIERKLLVQVRKIDEVIYEKKEKLDNLKIFLNKSRIELSKKIANNENYKTQIMTHCGNCRDYEKILCYQLQKLTKLETKKNEALFNYRVCTWTIENLKNRKKCRTCDRRFHKVSKIHGLLMRLTDESENYKNDVVKLVRELKRSKKKYLRLSSLGLSVKAFREFAANECAMRKKLKNQEIEVATMASEIIHLKILKKFPLKKIEMVQNMMVDLILCDYFSEDIDKIKVDINNLQETMPLSERLLKRTTCELQKEREETKRSIKNVDATIVALRLKLELREEALQRMREKRAEYLQEQLRIMKEMNQRRKKLDIPSEALVNKYAEQLDRVNAIDSVIMYSHAQNTEKKLEALTAEIGNYARLERENSEKYSLLEKQLTQINTNISSLKQRRNDFQNILNDRNSQKSLQKLEQSLSKIRERMSKLKNQDTSMEKEKLSKHYNEIRQAMSRAEGIKEQINNSLNQLREKSIVENYRITMRKLEEKMIEEKLIHESLKELHLYIERLDFELVKFHAGRIKLLNKCIHKLWSSIYRGNDIESIQIRADTVCRSNQTSFTYKLVQLRNGVEMNMRDHCSAGQRVLSSIVLRLALAETFCEDCGILSLDEPTTSLDADNSRSLAKALYNYVLMRNKYQKKFQLIIITHDEDFISKLNHLGHRDCCYEIYRSENSFSRVKYLRTNDDSTEITGGFDEEDKENRGENEIMKEN